MDLEEIKKLEKIDNPRQVGELMDYIGSKNTLKYNLTKTAEELMELGLVLLQYANKKGKCQPKKQELIDEVGDVLMRMEIMVKTMEVTDDEIEIRILKKANSYLKYCKEDVYREI